jgi:hypothetical protein
MYSRLLIRTRLTPGQVEEVLHKLVRPKGSLFQELDIPVGSGPPFVGRVEGNRFKFHRVITGRNSFLPIISGEIVATEEGTVLRGSMRLAIVVAIFITLWISATTYGALDWLSRASQTSDVMGGVIALGMPIFGLVLTVVGFVPERRKAISLLSEALAD